MGRRYLLI